MHREFQAGRDRHDAVMRRCRALERHAASLRAELMRLASGEAGGRGRTDRALRALQEELNRAGALADAFESAPSGDYKLRAA